MPRKPVTNRTLLQLQLLKTATGVLWDVEYRFSGTRDWRFDFACPELMLAIEVEGGAYTHGRHTRGTGFINDMEKYNAAAVLGWRLLRYTPQQFGGLKWKEDVAAILAMRVASRARRPSSD